MMHLSRFISLFILSNHSIKVGDCLASTISPLRKIPSRIFCPNNNNNNNDSGNDNNNAVDNTISAYPASILNYQFIAPEIWLEEHAELKPSIDVWSLGILLYVMASGGYPFDGKEKFDLFLRYSVIYLSLPSFSLYLSQCRFGSIVVVNIYVFIL